MEKNQPFFDPYSFNQTVQMQNQKIPSEMEMMQDMANPIMYYEQQYMYYKYLTQMIEYKSKLKDYESKCK